jgi:serine/threonine-protein kinase
MSVGTLAHIRLDGAAEGTTTYRRVADLAAGGMGTVAVCMRRAGRFERLYAVKRLHPHLRDDETMRAMFLDEARVAGMLRHANVVSVLDVGENSEGPFLVMDYVEGISLSRFIKHHAAARDLPPAAVCVHVVAQIARGLHAAHELVGKDGRPLLLVHRDVSPQNVLIGHDGIVRVTDFGVAKAIGRSTHTSTGLLKGKVGYMSPEHLRFEPLDRRSDLFALGVVLFELLTTERLYPGQDAAAVARRILREPPPDLGDARPDVPPALVELAFRLLAKDPADRPATAAEVADRLDDVVGEQGQVDLASYVDARLGAEIDEERVRIREMVAQLERVTDPEGAATTVVAGSSPPRGSWWRWPVALVGLAGVASAGVWLYTSLQARGDADLAAASPSPVEQTEQLVVLHVDSRPPGATVRVEEQLEGVTPIDLELVRGDDAVTVELALPGYVTTTHRLQPIRDERLVVALTPAPRLAPADAPPPADAEPRSGKRRRLGRRSVQPRASSEGRGSEPDRPRFRRFD